MAYDVTFKTSGTEAIASKIAGYRAALADVQPLTNRRNKVVVQKLVNVWEQRASRRFGTGVGCSLVAAPDTRDPIQYWSSVSRISCGWDRHLLRPGPRIKLDDRPRSFF